MARSAESGFCEAERAGVSGEATWLRKSAHGADKFGLKYLAGVHWNLPAEQLYEYALAGKEGHVVEGGAFCAETGVHTGRSPKDKFVVSDEDTENTIRGGQAR